jgi:hypothetical protein
VCVCTSTSRLPRAGSARAGQVAIAAAEQMSVRTLGRARQPQGSGGVDDSAERGEFGA